jgi:hypothetical protein
VSKPRHPLVSAFPQVGFLLGGTDAAFARTLVSHSKCGKLMRSGNLEETVLETPEWEAPLESKVISK